LTGLRHSGQLPIRRRRMCCSTRRTIGRVQRVVRRGKKRSAKSEEAVGDSTERRVVMKAAPGAAFEVVETELALEFLVVALDAPTQLREADECRERRRRRHIGEPVFVGRFGVAGFLYEEPLRFAGRQSFAMSMRGAYTHSSEAA